MLPQNRWIHISAMTLALSVTPAKADELNDLKQQLLQLQQRIEKLETEKAAIPSAPVTQDAITQKSDKPQEGFNGKYGVVTVSGHVNRAVIYADDGVDSGVYHVDNDNSATRLRVIGETALSQDWTIGAQLEVQFESNSSNDYVIDQLHPTLKNNSFTERLLETYFKHKKFGTLWLGQGDTASNKTSEKDISGTRVASYANISAMGGSLKFRDANTHQASDKVGSVFSDFDGLSRTDRLRYDSPNFGGMTLSTSFSDNDTWDLAGHYKRKIGSLKIQGGLAYSHPGEHDYSQINGSLSLLHDTGFNVTFAAGQRNLDDPADGSAKPSDPRFGFIKLGYQFKPNALGTLAVSYDYAVVNDLLLEQDRASTHSLALVQSIDKLGTELFAGYRRWSLDRDAIDLKDIDVLFAGALVRF